MNNDVRDRILEEVNRVSPREIHDTLRSELGGKHVVGNEAVFDFVARLKGIDNLDLDNLLEHERDDICRMWYAAWKDDMFDGEYIALCKPPEERELLSYEEILDQFEDAIPKVKFAKRDVLNRAIVKVESEPAPREALMVKSKPYKYAISLCYWLQKFQGDKPFFLSGKDLGKAYGVSQPRAWKILRGLTRRRRLEIAEEGKFGKSTRYWYLPLSTEEKLECGVIERTATETANQWARIGKGMRNE